MGRPPPPGRVRRPALSDHDLRVLAFAAEHRVVVMPHLQALLGAGPGAAEHRARALDRERLLVRRPIFAGQPPACLITRRGLNAIASRLPVPRLELRGYRHDVGVAWLWLAAGRGAFGSLTEKISERSMRSQDRRQDRRGPPLGVGLGVLGPGGGRQLHYPDLLLETDRGQRVAVELELTGKSGRRLEQIMLGYAIDPRIDAVLYLCPPGRVGERVQAAARRAGIGRRVHVQNLAEGSPRGAPAPERTVVHKASRSRAAAEL